MAEKIFTNVRLGLKVDTLENWSKSDLVLKRGEVAFATVAATAGNGLTEPVCMMKIGTGDKKFSELGWDFYAKASDVLAEAKSTEALTAFVNTVIADAKLGTAEDLTKLAERVTANEGALETLNGDADTAGSVAKAIADAIAALNLANTYDAKGAAAQALADAKTYVDGKDAAMDERVDVLEAAIAADGVVDTKIKNAIDALDVTDTAIAGKYVSAVNEVDGKVVITRADLPDYTETYAAKVHGHEIADVNGLSDAIADAKKAGTDANAALEAYKTTNDAAVANKVEKETGKALIAETEITRLAGMSDGANKVEASENNGKIKIDGVETTVYTHPTKHNITDIEGLQEALDGKQGSGDFAAENHKHTKEDITDFAHTHVASEITDLDATIKTYDYATKTEAQGYVDTYKTANDQALADEVQARKDADAGLQSAIDAINNEESGILAQAKTYADGKDAAIEAAQSAADAAQGDVDALAAKVGDVAEGKTVVQMISEAQTAATYNDAEVRGLITANANAIAAEKERAEGIEGGLETRLAAVEADYLTSTDKEALQTQINTIMNNPDAEGAINSINEFTQYIAEHGEVAEGFRTAIAENKKAIEDHEALAAQTYETKEDATAKYDELTELVNTKAVQADWNVNDPEDPAYIKNRPFYEVAPEENIVIFEGTIPAEDLEYNESYNPPYNSWVEYEFKEGLMENHSYTVVIDGVTYDNVIDYYGTSISVGDSNSTTFDLTTDGNISSSMGFATPGPHDVKIILKSRAYTTLLDHTFEAGEFTEDTTSYDHPVYRISNINDYISYHVPGALYNVTIDGVTYKNVECVDGYYDNIGDIGTVPFSIWFSNPTNLTVETPGSHHIKVDLVLSDTGNSIVQLDEKFIPDTIARVTDIKALENSDAAMAERLEAVEAVLGGGEGSVSEQIEAVKTELEGKIADAETASANQDAVVLAEAQKAATAAEEAAKAHADGLNTAMNTRVEALEAVDHEHANAAELDKFVDGDKAKLDSAVQNVTAAADSGLKATRTGNDVAIEIDDSVVFIFDCGTSAV